jgi:pimeloyl-ACP methyl ester carboxylesterase
LIPVALAAHVAQAVPSARLVVLEECGHFAYLESLDAFHEHVTALFKTQTGFGQ